MTPITEPGVEQVHDITQLLTFLVQNLGLTEADLARVVELQRARELQLPEALLQLKLVTAADLQKASQPSHRPALEVIGLAAQSMRFVREPLHPIAEQVRALRTELLRRQADRAHNCVAIVSSNTGDGRSSLAAALAMACAQLDQPTLLVDADLRQPRQHELFGVPRGPGLADTLDRGVPPLVLGVRGFPHLAVVSAGTPVSNPLELLSSKPFVDLMNSWRRGYRHVILDTTAAERGADVVAVAGVAGAAVVLARLNHTSLPASIELLKRLRSAEIALLGSVVLKAAL